MVNVKQGDEWTGDPTTIIDICIHYFKELIGPRLLITNKLSRARHEFYDVVGCTVHDLHSHDLDAILLRMRWTKF